MDVYADLLREFEQTGKSTRTVSLLMEHMVRRLHNNLSRCNSVVFYD